MGSVVSGVILSCGCLRIARCRTGLNLKHGDARIGHVSRLHNIWRGILKRCNPNNNALAIKHYAARGITICDEWLTYTTFRDWAMANGYADDLSIERKDNDKNYCPDNCTWATRKEQSRNRTFARMIEVNGESKCLAAWLEGTNVTRSGFYSRIARGWPMDRALGLRP